MSGQEAPMQNDWRRLDLTPGGRSLIEASAGTGKTWTIAMLYLRLLLEHRLRPAQVVVTTFTDAAASELRERLRARIHWAQARAQGQVAGTPVMEMSTDDAWLAQRWQADAAVRQQDGQHLQLALAELDAAPVFTLHALCQRVLAMQPFAAGGRFSQGTLVDGKSWQAQLLADYKRQMNQLSDSARDAWLPPALRAHLPAQMRGKTLLAFLQPHSEVPVPAPASLPGEPLITLLREAGTPGRLLPASSVLRRTWCRAAEWLASPVEQAIDDALLEGLRNTSAKPLKGKENDPLLQQALAATPVVEAALAAHQHHQRQAAWARLAAWLQQRRDALAAQRNERSFDDLLTDVHQVLAAENHAAVRPLADSLYAAWPVALVDEFQDTDGVQYGILDAIYRDAGGAPRGRLVMIGDAKQAIYRFRGGDIHSYQRALAEVPAASRLQLDTNHRSSRAMVAACNDLYRLTGSTLDAHGQSGIRHVPVMPSTRQDDTPYCLDGKPVEAALVVHVGAADASEHDALLACANQITQMLAAGRHRIGDAALAPADIAVLLPNNAQITALHGLLRERGVPAVAHSRQSVFGSACASEVQTLLYALLHPAQQAAMRAGMVGRIYGQPLMQLPQHDDGDWHMACQTFARWQQLWAQRGVQALVEAWLNHAGTRLLAEPDGERFLTDLRHLGELLQHQADAGLGAHELYAWLAAARSEAGQTEVADDTQLRLESDAARVTLMTLHRSKGLEFPVVFLPLMWHHRGSAVKRPYLEWLPDAASGKRQLHTDAAAAAQAAQAAQDERFRLLYVALTRAVHACHIYARLPADTDKPVDADSRQSAWDNLLSRLPARLDDLPALAAASPHIAWQAGWDTRGTPFWQATAAEAFRPHIAAMPLPRTAPLPMRHSFSGLTRGLGASDGSMARAADDETAAALPLQAHADEPPHPLLQALATPRGTALGNALHQILEQRSHALPVSAQLPLVEQVLAQHGLVQAGKADRLWANQWAQRLDACLATPLGPELPALMDVPESAQRCEMEFHFALAPTSLNALNAACAAHGEPALVPPSPRLLAGLMTGKIDLVFQHAGRFHVLDYKGNYLGEQLQAYRAGALAQAMAQHHYRFQALLYTVALERYLAGRLPAYQRAQHLGDAVYLFVRAVGLEAGAGIWRQRFPDALLDAVQAALPGVATEHTA